MERTDIENFKIRELFGATEKVIEDNAKIFIYLIIARLVVSMMALFVDISQFINMYIILLCYSIAGIIYIRSISTKFQIIEKEKQNINLFKSILKFLTISILLYIAVSIILVIVASVLLVIVGGILGIENFYSFLNGETFTYTEIGYVETLALLIILCVMLFVSVITIFYSVYIDVILSGIYYEIFVKNSKIISSVKNAFKNIHFRGNQVFKKMYFTNFLTIILSFILLLSVRIVEENLVMVMVVDILISILTIFNTTYLYLVYMSSTEKLKIEE